MPHDIRPVADSPMDQEPNAVGTPEGDNEILPDEPLQPSADIATEDLEVPRGSEPDPYKQDHK